uniref:HNH endonuclease 5 domain-containing protein n=1 Tax=viral metagenome TaxID=1070528 RepID=A0A6C0BB06_9ZZZZ
MPHRSSVRNLFNTISSIKRVKASRKQKIPVAIREAVWIKRCGKVFEHKCLTSWCPNIITVFDFQSGHNIPESKGGPVTVDNLYPLCSRCNTSMGDRYTFDQWTKVAAASAASTPPKRTWTRFFSCF